MSKMTKNKFALLALAGLSAVASGPVLAAGGMTVDSKGGLEVFELDEDNYWFKLSGRAMFDQVFFDTQDNDLTALPSGAKIRSARVTLKGGVGQKWVYKLDLDHSDKPGNPGRSSFGEAFIGYNGCPNFWFALGQISVPFGLDNWASLSDIPFMENSLPSQAFSPDFGLGLYAEYHGDMITLAGTVYHPKGAGALATGDVLSAPAVNGAGIPVAGVGPFDSNPGSDDSGIGGRITFAPIHDEYTVYHAGLSARYEKMHRNANFFNYVTGFEANARQTPVIFTNIPPNSSKHNNVWGFELAGRWGPFMAQGEYMYASVDRDGGFPVGDLRNPGGKLKYHGYHILATYVLTGEVREYDFESGAFGTVHPRSRKGAWEIGLRHSFVNLSDRNLASVAYPEFIDYVPPGAVDAFGMPVSTLAGNNFKTGIDTNDIVGAVHSTTVGLTWFVNDNIRFMANYIRTDLPLSTHADILGLRGQVTF